MTGSAKSVQRETSKTQSKLESAETRIKLFIAKCSYGEGDSRCQWSVDNRNLVFAVNYAYACRDTRISSLIFELQGSPSKGIIYALVGGETSGNIFIGSVEYIGTPVDKPTQEDYKEVRAAIEAFIKESNVPIRGIEPTTSKNAREVIGAFEKLSQIQRM